jgi:hypothetical protein
MADKYHMLKSRHSTAVGRQHSVVYEVYADMVKENSSDTIGNETRDLPACSTVPQPTAPPRDRVHLQDVNQNLLSYTLTVDKTVKYLWKT